MRRALTAAVAVAALVLAAPAAAFAKKAHKLVAASAVDQWGAFGGEGSSTPITSPASVNVPGTVVQVASSNSDEYLLTSDGAVYAEGFNNFAQLGNGPRPTRSTHR